MTDFYTAAELVRALRGVSQQLEARNGPFESAHQGASSDLREASEKLLQLRDDSRTREVVASLVRSTEYFGVIIDERGRAAALIETYVTTHFPRVTNGIPVSAVVPTRPDGPVGYFAIMAAAKEAEVIADNLVEEALIFGAYGDSGAAASKARAHADDLNKKAAIARQAEKEARKFDWHALVDVGFVIAGLVFTSGGLPVALCLVAANFAWKVFQASQWQDGARAKLIAARKPAGDAWENLVWGVAKEAGKVLIETIPFGAVILLVDYGLKVLELERIYKKHQRHHSKG